MTHAQILRQILVISGLTLCSISDGLIFGQMSGMIKALSHGEDDLKLDESEISWIASVINITCFCGFGIAAIMTDYYGRRKSITILSAPVLLCWLMVYFAQDKITLLLTRLLVGLSFGGILLLIFTNIGEYVSPKLRSLVLNITFSGIAVGTMLGHILGIIMHWRNVALLCMIPTFISGIMPLFWVESPSWLAMKKRFDECELSFKALHATSQASDNELKLLIEIQRNEDSSYLHHSSFLTPIKKYLKAFRCRFFWKANAIVFIVCIYRVAAGRIFINTLLLTMLEEITGTADIILYTFAVDGFMLLGSILSFVLVSKFNMRKLILSSGTVANMVQILLALFLYFWPRNDDQTLSWIKVSLFSLYCIIVTAGPYAVLETLLSELHPLELKCINMFVFGAFCGILQAMNIQIFVRLSSLLGYHGIFFINSIIIFLCLLFLYYYLPETKNRTLQEIELYFKDGCFPERQSNPACTEFFLNKS